MSPSRLPLLETSRTATLSLTLNTTRLLPLRRFSHAMDPRTETLQFKSGAEISKNSAPKIRFAASALGPLRLKSSMTPIWSVGHRPQMSLKSPFHSRFRWINNKTPVTRFTSGITTSPQLNNLCPTEVLKTVALLSHSTAATSFHLRTILIKSTTQSTRGARSQTWRNVYMRSWPIQPLQLALLRLQTHTLKPRSKSHLMVSNTLRMRTSSIIINRLLYSMSLQGWAQSREAQLCWSLAQTLKTPERSNAIFRSE